MWLYTPIENSLGDYRNNYDKSYTGWYYGAGYLDRICAKGIMILLKDKFDGISGKTGFYTPFSSNTFKIGNQRLANSLNPVSTNPAGRCGHG